MRDYRKMIIQKTKKIASLAQSARCPVVSQPYLAALYSGVVGGEDHKQI